MLDSFELLQKKRPGFQNFGLTANRGSRDL